MAKSHIHGQATVSQSRTAADDPGAAVRDNRGFDPVPGEGGAADSQPGRRGRRAGIQRGMDLPAYPVTGTPENSLSAEHPVESGEAAGGQDAGGEAADGGSMDGRPDRDSVDPAADSHGSHHRTSAEEHGPLYPLLREAAKSWCRQTFVATGPGDESGYSSVSHTEWSVIQAASDSELPWLTKKGQPRKQPPVACYELRFGRLYPAALARAINEARSAARDGQRPNDGSGEPDGKRDGLQSGGGAQLAAFGQAVARMDGPCWLGRVRLDSYGRPLAESYDLCVPAWAVSRAMETAGPASIVKPSRFGRESVAARRRLEHDLRGEHSAAGGRLRLAEIEGWISRAAVDCGLPDWSMAAGGIGADFELLSKEGADAEGAASEASLDADASERMELLASLYEAASARGALAAYVSGTAGVLHKEAPADASDDYGAAARRLALSARRIPPGRWTGCDASTDHTATPPSANGGEASAAGVSPEVSAEGAAEAGLPLTTELPADALPADALAASRAALSSFAATPARANGSLTPAGPALHSFVPLDERRSRGVEDGSGLAGGESARTGVTGALCAREVAAGAVIERARTLAALDDPGRAFGLRPPVVAHTNTGRSKLAVWSVAGLLSMREVLLRTPATPKALASQLCLPSPEQGQGVAGQQGRVLSGVLCLDDPRELGRRVETLAVELDERAGEIVEESGGQMGEAATERGPLLAAYEAAAERFTERLQSVESTLAELRTLEDDIRARSERRRRLVELDRQLQDLREEFAQSYEQFEQDGADLDRSDSALHHAQVHLETVESSRPNLAHRLVAPAAERRWAAEFEEARREVAVRAERAAADNRRYEQSQDDCRELNEAVMEAARRLRHHAGRMEAAEERIRASGREIPALNEALDEGSSESAGEAGLWPLAGLAAQRASLFEAALELHELFAVIVRRPLVDNLRGLRAHLEGTIEQSADTGTGGAGAHEKAHVPLLTDLLRTAALVAPVLAVSTPRSAGLLRQAAPGSVGFFIDCEPDTDSGDDPGDRLRLSGLHAAAVGLVRAEGDCSGTGANGAAADTANSYNGPLAGRLHGERPATDSEVSG